MILPQREQSCYQLDILHFEKILRKHDFTPMTTKLLSIENSVNANRFKSINKT